MQICRMRPALGTFVEIAASANLSRAYIEHVVDAAYADMALVEKLMSFHDVNSELSQLNRSRSPLTIHPWTARVLRFAQHMARASAHRFNPTVGGLLVEGGHLPDHGQTFIASGNADDIELIGLSICRRRAVLITLDGIAKGWAVDRAIARLRGGGITQAVVNAGGDWRCFGAPQIIRQSIELGGAVLGQLEHGACATSAAGLDATRFSAQLINDMNVVLAGHWTVIAPQAWRADALTKVAAAAAAETAADWVTRLGGQLITPPAQPRERFTHAG
ncbi:MAG: FAD:protein FMN transferase [Halothiobacillus sp.]